ncbi:MAG TPA: DUF6599 family protein [Polyangiaceae bacterium]
MHRTAIVAVALTSLAIVGCNKDRPTTEGTAPPPVESAPKPGACANGGGQVSDPNSAPFFPRQAAGYCLDPNGETRVFGEGGKLSMDAICTEAFDGECEVYKSFGLKRVVQLRYVDGAGSPGSVDIYLSQFATVEGAYGMFTKRVIADSDPAEAAPRKLDVGGQGALGTGRAYVWKANQLAEIQYANEQETPEQMKASSAKVLTAISTDIGQKLPGPPGLPPAAARLPTENLIPLGILFSPKDVLGIDSAGPGATGFYKAGDKRYRILSIAKDDIDQAKDALKTFARQRGAVEEKGIGDGAYRVVLQDKQAGKLEWIVARAGKAVLGVGDEEYAVQQGMTNAERDKVCLPKDDKIAHLKALVK